jgi:alkane 1-monooxygenase
MRAIPYLLPVVITSAFMLTANTVFVWLAVGMIFFIAFLRERIGRFSIGEVVDEYHFFHHHPVMDYVKSCSGLFFVVFDIWIMYFLGTHRLPGWALAVFIYSVIILNSNFAISLAHDLMHAKKRTDRFLATILLLQNGFFYLEADHVYIHHRHVGTAQDPATARVGEDLYSYFQRSVSARFKMVLIPGSVFPPGVESVTIRGNRIRLVICLAYLAGSAWMGWQAFLCVLVQFVLVTAIYESITYIQHYGLQRERDGAGKAESVRLHHSWNCFYRTSAYMHYMMPVHSIHHLKEEKLDTIVDFAGPSMPKSFATMMMTAWMPKRWFLMMNEKVGQITLDRNA